MRQRELDYHTLVDCECKARVYADGSGVDIDYCNLHRAAPILLNSAKFALSVIESHGVYDLSEKMAFEQLSIAIDEALGMGRLQS